MAERSDDDLFTLDDSTDDDGDSWLDELATGQLEDSTDEEPELALELGEEVAERQQEVDSWLDDLAPADDLEEEALTALGDLPEMVDEADTLADLSMTASETDLGWLDAAVDEWVHQITDLVLFALQVKDSFVH